MVDGQLMVNGQWLVMVGQVFVTVEMMVSGSMLGEVSSWSWVELVARVVRLRYSTQQALQLIE